MKAIHHINGDIYDNRLENIEIVEVSDQVLITSNHLARMVCKLLRAHTDEDSIRLKSLASTWLDEYHKTKTPNTK